MSKISRSFTLGAIERCYAWPNGTTNDAQLVNYGRLDADKELDADSEWGTCAESFGIMFPHDVQPKLGTRYVVTVEEEPVTTISHEEYVLRSDELFAQIYQKLNDKFGMLGDWMAGDIVDFGTDIDKMQEPHTVGIRLDNNYGVVGPEDALKFCEALTYATKLLAESDLIGCEVTE